MNACRDKDLASKPLSAVLIWGLPLAVIVASPFVLSASSQIQAAAFFWMGAACLFNARRCGRIHCFITGPVFLFAGIAVLLSSYLTLPIGGVLIAAVVLCLTLKAFAIERWHGRYRGTADGKSVSTTSGGEGSCC